MPGTDALGHAVVRASRRSQALSARSAAPVPKGRTMATLSLLRPAPGTPTNPGGPGEAVADPVRRGTRWLLSAFVGLTSLAVLALLVSPGTANQDFAWSIHMPLTAAFLGAAYAAGCLLSVLSLRQRTWREIRVPLHTVAAFTTLTLVATLIHTHRLHLLDGGVPARAAAWLWLAV